LLFLALVVSADSQRRGRQQTAQTHRQQIAAPPLGYAAVDNGRQPKVQTRRQQVAAPHLGPVENGRQQTVQTHRQQVASTPLGYAAVDNGRQQTVKTHRQQVAAPSLSYAAVNDIPAYGDVSNAIPFYGTASDPGLKALTRNIPGVPGDDYPVFAEVPETAFTCEGQVDGG
jgi:hypothetical protein